ncbi:MAG: hypothetical protein KBG15_10095, partial [Kofleriaceae bacterium]|nr:hypothetical protein [Kofleriaceae bacterium]
MSLPREILPGRFYTLTRRCVNRMFLLRPDEQTNNNYLYCLILAAIRFNIVIIATCAVSNHHHTNLLDRDGRLPEFVHYFHALLARCQNCYRGRWEHFWASGGPSAVELVAPEDIERAVVYTLTNPVKDFLVEEVTHWPGVNSWSALRADRALTATRPQHFFRKRMPARVELKMTVPAEAGVQKSRLGFVFVTLPHNFSRHRPMPHATEKNPDRGLFLSRCRATSPVIGRWPPHATSLPPPR